MPPDTNIMLRLSQVFGSYIENYYSKHCKGYSTIHLPALAASDNMQDLIKKKTLHQVALRQG